MKKNQKSQVWIDVADKTNDPAFFDSAKSEFVELPIVDTLGDEEVAENYTSSRRDFLKYMGFGLGAATLAASCEIPVKKAIPYVTKPDTIVPGVATYYASSFVRGGDYCSVLVKTREGRPIKIEGNTMSSITRGGTSARAQASVLSLYDTSRYRGVLAKDGESWSAMTWSDLDAAVKGKLNARSNIRLICNTMMSPTGKQAINEFVAAFPNTKVVMYDPVSSSAILEAHETSFGKKLVPDYKFDKADLIVSLGADFLGTWISPIEYAAQYAENRKIKDPKHPKMSRHIQVEGAMSLTGSNADDRILIRPSEQGAAIANLYNEVASKKGGARVSAPALNEKALTALKGVAAELVAANGKSLVVSGSNNVGEQILINAINNMLGNYGTTISFDAASMQRQGIDKDIQGCINDMNAGRVDAAIVMDANPAFDLPNAAQFVEAFGKVSFKLATSGFRSETAEMCDYIAPSNHYLESWGDVEPKRGHYSLIQPTIAPLYNTRQAEHSLLVWSNSSNLDSNADQPYYEYLKNAWQANMFSQQNKYRSFQAFWDSALHDGVLEIPFIEEGMVFSADVNAAASKINKPSSAAAEISFFETVNIGAGQYADNPWLQEMPDPISRCAWGNVLYVPISWDGKNDFDGYNGIGSEIKKGKGDLVDLTSNGVTERVSATTSFGSPFVGDAAMVAMALGYGRTVSGEAGLDVGQNAYPMLSMDANGNTKYYADAEVSTPVAVDKEFACVQYHHTMGVFENADPTKNVDDHAIGINGYDGAITDRSVIYHEKLDRVPDLLKEIEYRRHHANHLNDKTLYPFKQYTEEFYSQGHHWGMHIDMNACIGCGACTVACMSENNVPVVGKNEMHRHHEMAWIRIDRYFVGDVENPNVVYQPMMCQHCDNAPCENVCPVAATNHSSEGLNQMTYNRCIGTRYCANNCPYKVRRFNWLDYTTADLFAMNEYDVNGEAVPYGADNLTRMVLNPDVTVRSRGVIEKCSFCVQRIQEGKLTAKKEGRALQDHDVKTACQSSCPTGAITFGDMNDKHSMIAKVLPNSLNYRVLEEINTQSSVYYSAKILNSDDTVRQVSDEKFVMHHGDDEHGHGGDGHGDSH